jgi:hypothetical protein
MGMVDGGSFVGEIGRKTECNRSVLTADQRTAAKCDVGGEPGYCSLPGDTVTWLREIITRANISIVYTRRL